MVFGWANPRDRRSSDAIRGSTRERVRFPCPASACRSPRYRRVGLVIGLLALAWMLLSGRRTIHPVRFALYAFALCVLRASLVGQSRSFCGPSFAMLSAICLPFVAVAAARPGEWLAVLRAFRGLVSLVAVLGLGQFAIQFVSGPAATFRLDKVLGSQLFLSQFNLRIPLLSRSLWRKSAGFVCLEPSHVVQALAFVIMIGAFYVTEAMRLVLYGAAYPVSLSGAGLVLLMLLGVPILLRARSALFVGICAVRTALIFLFLDLPILAAFLERIDESSNPLASGYMRFVRPISSYRTRSSTMPFVWLSAGARQFPGGRTRSRLRRARHHVARGSRRIRDPRPPGMTPLCICVHFTNTPIRLRSAEFVVHVAFGRVSERLLRPIPPSGSRRLAASRARERIDLACPVGRRRERCPRMTRSRWRQHP